MPRGWSGWPFGPGRFGPICSGVEQAVAEVSARRCEHRAHVARREGRVLRDEAFEVRGDPADLVDDALAHLGLETSVVRVVGLDRETTGRTPTPRACRAGPGRGPVPRGICKAMVGSAGTMPRRQSSHCCCSSSGVLKRPMASLHCRFIEQLVRLGELRGPVQGEVHLDVTATVGRRGRE